MLIIPSIIPAINSVMTGPKSGCENRRRRASTPLYNNSNSLQKRQEQYIKARVAFQQLRNILNARAIVTQTKFRIFKSNVKSVLLYGSETWRTTNKTTRKVQTFIKNCIRRIPKIQ